MQYFKQKSNINVYYLAYGFRETNKPFGEWEFLGLRKTITDIHNIIEKFCWKYDTIRVLKFDADVYGTEML